MLEVPTHGYQVLGELQDNLPPFPTRQAVSIIEEELGAPINTIFSQLSEIPVAAASFGQVIISLVNFEGTSS